MKRAKNSNRRLLINSMYRGNKFIFVIAVIFSILSAGGNLFFSWLLGEVIDTIGNGNMENLKRIGIITLCTIPTYFAIEAIRWTALSKFQSNGMRRYKEWAFQAISKKSISAFTNEKTATYLSCFTNDITSISSDYLWGTVHIIYNIVMFFAALAMMLKSSPVMTGIVIALCVIPILVSVTMGNGLAKREKQVSDMNGLFTARLKDLLGGFAVIKSFKAEKRCEEVFAAENRQLENAKEKRRIFSGLLSSASETSGITVQLGIFFVGAVMALNGHITAGTVLVFVNLVNSLTSPIQYLPELFANRKAADGLINKMVDLLDANTESDGLTPIEDISKGITMNDVTFGYEDDKHVIKKLTCNFEKGKSYAIVGSSGCGKSTLLNLILGAHNKYQGSIKIDDREINTVSSDSIFDSISMIGQNVFIFDDTIRNNITMYSPFSDEEVNKAVTLAGLDEVINARGEDYLCGENGVNLSGGERQRISIARSLLKGSKVLLVDEATSALDNETARHVGNSLLDLKELTRIVVTHRMDEVLLKKYDEIVMMKNGAVCEQGDFDSLMSRKGNFYALYTVENG